MKFIGAHVSTSGGLAEAPRRAASISADALALFVRNQRRWTAPPLSAKEVSGFDQARVAAGLGVNHIVVHGSYLINPAHPDKQGLDKSRAALLDEVRRTEALGLMLYNLHPGSSLGRADERSSLLRVAESISWVLAQTQNVTLVLETTAGQGSHLGHRFEHLAEIIAGVSDPSRVGICVDTCHVFAAGYDIRSEAGYDRMVRELDAVVGLARLRALHVNDSKSAFGSRVDRHQLLGKGELGVEPFSCIMQDCRLDGLPLVLETPDPERWAEEIALLRSFA